MDGSRLRAVREVKGLTLTEVARRAEIHPSQLSRFERGVGGLSLPRLRRLAGVLDIPELEKVLRPFDEAGSR